MDYVIASYRGGKEFGAATQVIELFMWLALVGIVLILITFSRAFGTQKSTPIGALPYDISDAITLFHRLFDF